MLYGNFAVTSLPKKVIFGVMDDLMYEIIHDTMSLRSKTFDHSLLNHLPPDTEAKVAQKKPHYSQVRRPGHQGTFID